MKTRGKKKVFVLVNPVSGGVKSINIGPRIKAALTAKKIDFDLLYTKKSIGAMTLCRSIDENIYDTVIAAGGDGTINEVVNGLAGKKIRLGIIPAGTVNVLAKELGIPLHVEKAIDTILKGKEKVIDTVMADQRVFVLMAGVGFDAYSIFKVDSGIKRYVGALAYLLASLYALIRYPSRLLRISMDNGKKKEEGYFVLVSNTAYYGGKIPVAPDARMDDGYIDVLVFKSRKLHLLFHYLGASFFRRQSTMTYMKHYRVKNLTVASDHNVLVHTDAEIAGSLPMRFQVLPKSLRVLIP